eukprot:scaffold6187_cov202-Prasinococcus_capsulatus_cf.AAC.1
MEGRREHRARGRADGERSSGLPGDPAAAPGLRALPGRPYTSLVSLRASLSGCGPEAHQTE